MKSLESKLFSTLGYDALQVILGVNPRKIAENEIKKLISLVHLAENNLSLRAEIENIQKQKLDESKLKNKLLQLADHSLGEG